MLSRGLLAALTSAAFLLCSPIPASASSGGSGVQCPPHDDTCVVSVTNPGAPGSGGSDGGPPPAPGSRVCYWPGTTTPLPCESADGWWSDTYQCYFQLSVPQPAVDNPIWGGHFPTGAVYDTTCPDTSVGTGGGWMWLNTPPDGFGGGVFTPAQLAARAVKALPIEGPAIGMAPGPGKVGLVGLPVWLWTAVSARTWGPATATAAIPGLSVTATAKAEKVLWDMGDGHTVTCRSPGTPYQVGLGGGLSPTCGYVYQQTSGGRPGGMFVVTATTTWAVTWVGGGQAGALTVTRTSTSRVAIGELQVLVT